MVTATIVKNTFGVSSLFPGCNSFNSDISQFGMIFYYNDWAVNDGFIPPVMTMMALTVGFTAVGMVIFMIWGKNFRRRTMNSKLHLL
jgi:hypothetical protein